MTDTKARLEQLLRLNGITRDASDEEIAEVLSGAGYTDIQTAITTLRAAHTQTKQRNRKEVLEDLMASDEYLSPQGIKRLLGVDVEVQFQESETLRAAQKHMSLGQVLTVTLFSLLFATIALVGLAWYYGILPIAF